MHPQSVRPDGFIIFENVRKNTYLFVDGEPVSVSSRSSIAVPVEKGSHKIEIYNATERKTFFVEIEPGTFVTIKAGKRAR